MSSDPFNLLLKTFCDFLIFIESKNFIHASKKWLLSIYCVPGSVLGAGDTAERPVKTSALVALIVLWRRQTISKISK